MTDVVIADQAAHAIIQLTVVFPLAHLTHKQDDRYFVSGSLDGRLRLWSIPPRKVTLWNEVDNAHGSSMITAASFCAGGRMVVVGTYDGRCLFYDSEVRSLAAAGGHGGHEEEGLFVGLRAYSTMTGSKELSGQGLVGTKRRCLSRIARAQHHGRAH